MIREVAYDEVFDAQKHYRSLLDSVSRPGKINRLQPVHIDPPAGLNAASALIAFALMDSDSTFETVSMNRGEDAYLAANTNARRTEIERANFIFAQAWESPEFLDDADCGTLLYPDMAATLVLQLTNASAEPLSGGFKLTITGPGVDGMSTMFVSGINPDLLLAIQARNAEFPLGLDTILTFVDSEGVPCVVGLPRTARVKWEAC